LNLLPKINCDEKISPNEGRRGINAGGGLWIWSFCSILGNRNLAIPAAYACDGFPVQMMRSEAMAERIFPPCKMGLSNFVHAAKYRIRYIMPTKMGA
jgi:hypothetical protein